VPDLLPGEDTRRLSAQTLAIEEFLFRHVQANGWPAPAAEKRILLHGHCHQKALVGMEPSLGLLRAAGFTVDLVDSGCCGMAGSFGFEREHYNLSLAMGERRLLPAVRRAPEDTTIVAMGVSCRQQIAHGAGRRARHLVEVLAGAMSGAGEPTA
jgi:Fe-S oxidoreductase